MWKWLEANWIEIYFHISLVLFFLSVLHILNMMSIKKVKVKSLSCVWLFATPWTVAYQAPPSMGFSRQEYWSGLPFPSPGDLPDPGIEPGSSTSQADALPSEPPGKPYMSALEHVYLGLPPIFWLGCLSFLHWVIMNCLCSLDFLGLLFQFNL